MVQLMIESLMRRHTLRAVSQIQTLLPIFSIHRSNRTERALDSIGIPVDIHRSQSIQETYHIRVWDRLRGRLSCHSTKQDELIWRDNFMQEYLC